MNADVPARTVDHDDRMIVVGIDGSEGAARALEFAAEEAMVRQKGLRIVAAWRIPSPVFSGGTVAPSFSLDEFEHSMRAAAEKQAAEGLAAHPDLVSELVVKEGNPAQVLLEESAGADMLVLGS